MTDPAASDALPLACPSCARRFASDERFCPDCSMPLTLLDPTPVEVGRSEAHERARKVDPRFTEGELVRVAGGRHQAEAEMIQGMLLEEGVPSMLRRSPGFDVPDFLAAGPRDVMVASGGYTAAREVLLQAEIVPVHGPQPQGTELSRFFKLLAVIAIACVLCGLLAYGLSA